MELGVRKQVRVSAKALKRVKKDIADGKKPVIALITSQGTK